MVIFCFFKKEFFYVNREIYRSRRIQWWDFHVSVRFFCVFCRRRRVVIQQYHLPLTFTAFLIPTFLRFFKKKKSSN